MIAFHLEFSLSFSFLPRTSCWGRGQSGEWLNVNLCRYWRYSPWTVRNWMKLYWFSLQPLRDGKYQPSLFDWFYRWFHLVKNLSLSGFLLPMKEICSGCYMCSLSRLSGWQSLSFPRWRAPHHMNDPEINTPLGVLFCRSHSVYMRYIKHAAPFFKMGCPTLAIRSLQVWRGYLIFSSTFA